MENDTLVAGLTLNIISIVLLVYTIFVIDRNMTDHSLF